jgi:hypothetical protein
MVWDLEHFVLADDRVTCGTLADPCFFAGETATKEDEDVQLTRREEKRREEKRREEKIFFIDFKLALWAKMKHNI